MHIAFVKTLLDIFFAPDSPIKNTVNLPTLVVISKYDRYYYPSYVKRYYESLNEPKKMHEMDDSHLAFVWNSEEICQEASTWVHEYSHK